MVLSMDRWKGKVAIVTGASTGCGAVIAEQLVRSGVNVVGLARQDEKVEELSKKLKDLPGKLFAFKADVSKEDDIKAAFKWTTEHLGLVHILVNNAATIKVASFIEGDPQSWKDVLNTNVFGLAVASQEALKNMIDNNVDGHIININSIAGHYVCQIPNINLYPASKFAVTALTETLRQELIRFGAKIKVSSVSPGGIDTDFAKKGLPEEKRKSYNSSYRKLQCEDVADAVMYALSTPPHVQIHELTIRPIGEAF